MLSKSFEKVASGSLTVWLYLFFIDKVQYSSLVNWIEMTEVPYKSCLCGFGKSSLLMLSTSFFTAKNTWQSSSLPPLKVQSCSFSL